MKTKDRAIQSSKIPSLAQMVAKITSDNRYAEVSLGAEIGREIIGRPLTETERSTLEEFARYKENEVIPKIEQTIHHTKSTRTSDNESSVY